MNCKKCGSVITDQTKFCPSCGASLQGENISVIPSQQPMQYIVVEPKKTNVFAILSLCFFWTFIIGLAFGIVGLVNSKKLESGRAMSAVGIALSVFWLLFLL